MSHSRKTRLSLLLVAVSSASLVGPLHAAPPGVGHGLDGGEGTAHASPKGLGIAPYRGFDGETWAGGGEVGERPEVDWTAGVDAQLRVGERAGVDAQLRVGERAGVDAQSRLSERPGIDARLRWDDRAWMEANNIKMMLTNVGWFGHDQLNSAPGLIFPAASQLGALYAGGLWIAARVGDEAEPRVAVAEYSTEYVGGSLDEHGSWDPNWTSDPHWRVYDVERGNRIDPDYLEWPVEDGAPVTVGGSPRFLGDVTSFAVFHDADPAKHYNDAGGTDPLGVEVQQIGFAGDGDYVDHSVIFLQWKITNRSGQAFHDTHVTFWADPDLGDSGDDLAGCSPESGTGFVYNDGWDFDYADQPPVVGFRLVQGPIVPSPGDIAYVSGEEVPDYRNLPLSAFVFYANGEDPRSPDQTYNLMRGLHTDGSPIVDPTTGEITTFMAPGEPFESGWNDDVPGDKRILLSVGPFDMAPGESQTVAIAVVVGQGGDVESSLGLFGGRAWIAGEHFRYAWDDADGACCFEGGRCAVVPSSACIGRFVYGTTCSQSDCGWPRGACCMNYDGCLIGLEVECEGTYLGDGSVCEPGICPPAVRTGACCHGVVCEIAEFTECTGSFQGLGSTCDPSPCFGIVWPLGTGRTLAHLGRCRTQRIQWWPRVRNRVLRFDGRPCGRPERGTSGSTPTSRSGRPVRPTEGTSILQRCRSRRLPAPSGTWMTRTIRGGSTSASSRWRPRRSRRTTSGSFQLQPGENGGREYPFLMGTPTTAT
ncbi:MAG: hypothetical protein R3E97_12540 [Candidatus Eisenbacteria bacterium]